MTMAAELFSLNQTAFALGLTALGIATALILRPRRAPLPPGPRRLPIVGNFFDLPKNGDPLPWKEHLGAYGPISSVTVLGQTIVILNDLPTCIDLLIKRSTVYAGRPIFPFAGGMVGWDQQMILAQPGEHFRAMRKLMKSYLGSSAAIVSFQPIQELETRHFLTRILDEPAKLVTHIRLTAGAISLQISHGYAIETEKPDPLVYLVERAAKEFYFATMPGVWLVDMIPSLQNLPSWLPGTGFKKVGSVYRDHNYEQADRPHDFVKRRMAAGQAQPSFTSAMLSAGVDERTEHAVKFAANAVYGGGSDPAVAALSTFFLLMIMYPATQKRARDEIDSVVGSQRLPNFGDRSRLPYVDALIKEVLRWHPVGRIGIPHRATQDDIYNGYLIPKNSIILPHMWNITRDPSIYSDASDFNPSRFLPGEGREPELDPNTYMFGFGRRECPGQDFSNANMFILVAMTLAVFDLRKAKDENGVDIEPRCEFDAGTVSHPKPFEIDIRPRSADAKALIQSVLQEEGARRPSDGSHL